ncbi:hypothetical protein TanjilG_20400 [Lupinus angustifolius]|uniref:Uncharacterized protein n=1 Tax=Lupinus angustifolius TaxID=3871 RepID=A0A4P1RWE1_LUPAN|nr:hypothetical protein TanjilG_20400 [Lupinus angustifolius]
MHSAPWDEERISKKLNLPPSDFCSSPDYTGPQTYTSMNTSHGAVHAALLDMHLTVPRVATADMGIISHKASCPTPFQTSSGAQTSPVGMDQAHSTTNHPNLEDKVYPEEIGNDRGPVIGDRPTCTRAPPSWHKDFAME